MRHFICSVLLTSILLFTTTVSHYLSQFFFQKWTDIISWSCNEQDSGLLSDLTHVDFPYKALSLVSALSSVHVWCVSCSDSSPTFLCFLLFELFSLAGVTNKLLPVLSVVQNVEMHLLIHHGYKYVILGSGTEFFAVSQAGVGTNGNRRNNHEPRVNAGRSLQGL